ncbi:MAG: hypothetical protein ACUVSD_11255, partial [Thiobacillaceae bacterium]
MTITFHKVLKPCVPVCLWPSVVAGVIARLAQALMHGLPFLLAGFLCMLAVQVHAATGSITVRLIDHVSDAGLAGLEV